MRLIPFFPELLVVVQFDQLFAIGHLDKPTVLGRRCSGLCRCRETARRDWWLGTFSSGHHQTLIPRITCMQSSKNQPHSGVGNMGASFDRSAPEWRVLANRLWLPIQRLQSATYFLNCLVLCSCCFNSLVVCRLPALSQNCSIGSNSSAITAILQYDHKTSS